MGATAANFSTVKAYAKDDLCLYDGVLYKFTSSHSAGAWSGTDVQAVDGNEQQDLTRILSGMDNAVKATAYVGTVVFEPALISGTKYKYILTNALDPRG